MTKFAALLLAATLTAQSAMAGGLSPAVVEEAPVIEEAPASSLSPLVMLGILVVIGVLVTTNKSDSCNVTAKTKASTNPGPTC